MAVPPSVTLALRDGRSVRALRRYYGLASEDVGRVMGLSGRRVRQWEEQDELEPVVAERLRAAIEGAVVRKVTHQEVSP